MALDEGSRARRAANWLLVVVAVAGIGWGGREIWAVWQNRSTVNEACADMVPAGQVMKLPHSGGRLEASDERIDPTVQRSICRIYSTEAGEAAGQGSGTRLFFEATAAVDPEPFEVRGERADLAFDKLIDEPDHSYLDNPLGGGIPGLVKDNGVTVKLVCRGAGAKSDGARTVVAGAFSSTAGHTPLTTGRQVAQDARDRLAVIAVTTANRLGERLGCEGRLPDPPSRIPSVRGELIDATKADGTCAWYDRWSRGRDDTALPTRAVETAADPDVWREKCGLALDEDRARSLWNRFRDADPEGAAEFEGPTEQGALWASTQSWFGESARDVRMGDRLEPTRAETGKAGRAPDQPAWWASSVCDGQPAVHTLTLSFRYGRAAAYDEKSAARFAPLFRAYVEDVAKRRGCTDLRFPESTDFTGPRK